MVQEHFPVQYQKGKSDCGPTCLKIIATYFEKNFIWKDLLRKCRLSEKGTTLKGLSTGVEYLGLTYLAVKGTIEDLVKKLPLPMIVFWKEQHFAVVYRITKKFVYVSDPSDGLITYTYDAFREGWYGKGKNKGLALIVG